MNGGNRKRVRWPFILTHKHVSHFLLFAPSGSLLMQQLTTAARSHHPVYSSCVRMWVCIVSVFDFQTLICLICFRFCSFSDWFTPRTWHTSVLGKCVRGCTACGTQITLMHVSFTWAQALNLTSTNTICHKKSVFCSSTLRMFPNVYQ